MAGGLAGVGISKRVYSYTSVREVAVPIFIATCASILMLDAQSDLGFVSLDCGGSQTNYNDSHGLLWVPDSSYISNGNSSVTQEYGGDEQSLRSFRYFPGDRSKYCYYLFTPDWTYLVRVSFYMDQAAFAKRHPFEFVFSMDATDWFTVTSGDAQSSLLVVQEAIFYPPYYYTNFCLRPVSGEPFISSLELRLLDNSTGYMTDMYSYQGRVSQFLALGVRYNAGAKNVPDVRYPEDPYDRIWTTPSASVNSLASFTGTKPAGDTQIEQLYYVPPEVMQDAWLFPSADQDSLPDTTNRTITLTVFATGPQVYSTPSEYAFVVVYSQIVNTSDHGPHEISIGFDRALDSSRIDTLLDSSTQANMGVFPYKSLSSKTINLTLIPYDSSTSRPSLNAVEVYSQLTYNSSITNGDDDQVIEALKTMFSLTDWQGDPCVPVPHNWLSCAVPKASFGQGHSCSTCGPARSIFATFFNIASLNLSNITNTNFSGIIGNLSALPSRRLHALSTMAITSSGVDSPTFLFLINYTSPQLVTLNLSNNVIDYLPKAIDWAGNDNVTFGNLTTLDLSHNRLTGPLSKDVHFSTALQYLKLSHNSLRSFPENWENSTSINYTLISLDLSFNQFDQNISSLDEWVQVNSNSLQELDVSNNKLGGMFSSDLYFSLPNLTYANFDQNSIQGILNLSTWYADLLVAARPYSGDSSKPGDNSIKETVTQKLLSFVNNSIVDIVPSAEDFDSTTHALFKSKKEFGVMLYGNPYCNEIKSSVKRHLCRSSISDPFKEDSKGKDPTILIVIIFGAVFALVMLSTTSATVWKLRKQVYSLRVIQQALAERKVQPPFYKYNDLRIATKDFHNSNKLGNGGFGVVYKGVIADEALAVKKLFNSREVQVLDEFLNEVVLITGIQHRNLVRLKGCCIKDKQRLLVYEYAEKGNLAEALWGSHVPGGLTWKQRLNICVGVARGLSYLHEELQPSIIHRDIKPQNILLDNDFNPKIADFGLARHVSDDTTQAHYTQLAGTLGYFAPEYAMQGQVSDKTDVYSYGILILEVVSGRKCIDSTGPIEEKFLTDWVFRMKQKSSVFDILQPELREHCNVAEVIRVIDIALLCVQHHPGKRPTMSQVVNMFSGNRDIDSVADESANIRSKFKDLMATIDYDAYSSPLQIVHEESPIFPLLNLESQSSSDISSSTSNSRPNLELSAVRGR